METGNPYMLYKDHCNRKSNQRNLGVIKGSNLCTEIIEYHSSDETAVCNLAALALPRFVFEAGLGGEGSSGCKLVGSIGDGYSRREFDFNELKHAANVVVCNLDQVINVTHYPVEGALRSNYRHRPLGVGVIGLADVFILLGLSFGSAEARQLNRDIFECTYFSVLETSCRLARQKGIYSSFINSPINAGLLQFDLWDAKPEFLGLD